MAPSPKNNNRFCSRATRSHTTHRDHIANFLAKPQNQFKITDEVISAFKQQKAFYHASIQSSNPYVKDCLYDDCVHDLDNPIPFDWPFACSWMRGSASYKKQAYLAKQRAHHKKYMGALAKKLRVLFRAFIRVDLSFTMRAAFLFSLSEFIYQRTAILAFPVQLDKWVYKRYRPYTLHKSKKVAITSEVFIRYYLRTFIEEFKTLNWNSHIAFFVDSQEVGKPATLSDVIEYLNTVEELADPFDYRNFIYADDRIDDDDSDNSLVSQIDAPDFMKHLPAKKKRSPRQFAKQDQETRQHQKRATLKILRARLEKIQASNNEAVGLESQIDDEFQDAPVSPDVPPPRNLLDIDNEELQRIFDEYEDEENPIERDELDADEVPTLLSKLYAYMTKAKSKVTDTATWLSENIISIQDFFSRLWQTISKGFCIVAKAVDWAYDQEDILYIPKLVVLFLIYVVGYSVGCSTIAKLLASVYAVFVFDGTLKWIPALLALSTSQPDVLYSHSGDSTSDSLLTTAVSLLAASLFGKLASLNIDRRSGFFATMDVVSRGLNGTLNIGEKMSLLFKKAVGLFGLEQFGFSPDLEAAFPQDFEELIKDIRFFTDANNVKSFNTRPENCRRAENMRRSFLNQQAKYAKSPALRNKLASFSPFVHKIADIAALRDPAHTKIRTEPVCVFLYGDPNAGKSVAMNLIAAAVLQKHGFIPKEATAAQVSKCIAENFYVRNGEEDFWNGYHNQFIAAEDDILQQKDSEANPSSHPMEFIRVSNSFPYPLNMAELQDKGTTYFQSALFLATTNMAILNPPSIASQDAYLRRITLPFKVEIKPSKLNSEGRPKAGLQNGYDLDLYDFYYHDFKTGITDNKTNGVKDSSKALSLQQVCSLINTSLEKKKDESAKLEDACLAMARLFSQVGEKRVLISAGDLNIEISEAAKQKIDAYVISQAEEYAVMHGLILWARDHQGDAMHDLVHYYKARCDSAIPTYSVVFDPRDHMSNLMKVKVWMRETKEKFQSWLKNIKWKRILTFLGYATTLAAVSTFAGQYTYNLAQKHSAPPPQGKIQETFDREVKGRGIYRSAPHQAHAFTRGEHHIPYRYDQPTPFSWFYPRASFSAFSSNDHAEIFDAAVDAFTREHGSPAFLAKFSPNDYEPTKYGLTWLSPSSLERTRDLDGDYLSGYAELLQTWNADPGQLASMSGKTRNKLRSALNRKAPVPLNNLSSHVGNKNADEVLSKVQQNQAILWSGKTKNNLLFFQGRRFLFNYHAFRIFEQKSQLDPIVSLVFGTASAGTQLRFDEIKWTKVADKLSDVIIGEFPRHVCPEFRSIIHAFINKDDIDRLRYKQALMSIPSQNGFLVRTGSVRSLVTEEVNDKLGSYKVYGAELAVTSRKGDCGAPYVLDSSDCRRIFAIHTAGNESLVKSVGTIVTQEMLSSVSQIGEETLLHGNVIDKGHLPPVFSNTKSQIVPTAIHNKVIETQMAPAVLAKFDTPNGPMAKAIAKQFGPVYHIDEKILHYASRSYMKMLNQCAPPEEMGVLSFRRATRGDEGSDYIRPINRMRSAGYDFVLHTKQKGKTKWFSEDWVPNEHTIALENRINQQIAQMEQGEVQSYIFLDTLKDETRPIAKVLEGKTRVFAAAPMDFIIVFRMYFLTFLAHMMRNRIDNESAVGIKAQSEEWTLLYHKLVTHGPRVIAGDFSNYDGSLNPRILWAVFDIIEHFYALAGATPSEQNVRRCLWSNIVNSEHLCGDVFYQLNHSQPSGNPSTAILNSMYNSIACRYVFYHLYTPGTEFNEYVSMIAYGDDNVLNVSEQASLYNQENMARIFASFGMTYTDEDKTGELMDKSIDQVSFLKRRFAYDEEMRFCYAPLALPSILECFNWTKKSDSELDIIVQNANAAYVELAMHSEEEFKYWSRKISNAIKEGYDHQNFPVTTWSGYRMEIRCGFSIENIEELDWS